VEKTPYFSLVYHPAVCFNAAMPNRALTDDDLKLLRETFASKDDVRLIVQKELDIRVGRLPTKDEFFTGMSNLMGKVKAGREDLAVHEKQHQDIHDQLDDHEKDIQLIKTNLALNSS
jgi:hypothetical protein